MYDVAPLQRTDTQNRSVAFVPRIICDVPRSPGLPLDAATRARMQSSLGHDFSRVRVHTDDKAAEAGADRAAMAAPPVHISVVAPGGYLYRTPAPAGFSSSATPASAGSRPDFEQAMLRRCGTTAVRIGTQADQIAVLASFSRQPASAITLPQWQSWDPGANSPVYERVLDSVRDFGASVGGVPAIREVVFFDTDYDVTALAAGVVIAQPNPNVGADFSAGVLTVYRAVTLVNKALPIGRSSARGNYPRVVGRVHGVQGATPGAPLASVLDESMRRQLTHELGHGLAEAATTLETGLFSDYRSAAGWTSGDPARLFDIGQLAVRNALNVGVLPPARFEITPDNWNDPRWVEQPVSDYVVRGGPSNDFAEAIMVLVREPNLLLTRSPRRFRFLRGRQDRWLPALVRTPQAGDFSVRRRLQQVA